MDTQVGCMIRSARTLGKTMSLWMSLTLSQAVTLSTIETKVSTCDALIALIGKNWLTIKDEQNQVRLTKPGDFVSVEIAAALKRSVEVIPF